MNKSNWFWPDVTNLDEAKKACRSAMWCAIFVASVTTIVALIAISGVASMPLPVNGTALFDAGIFAGIAYGLSRCSRFAGVAGFVLFLFEKLYMLSKGGAAAGGLILGVFLLLGFLHGMRGAFAVHKLQTQTAVPLTAPPFS